MSSITVNTLVLGSLTVAVDGSDSTLALSVLGTAPASLTIELGTPGAQGDAATIAVGTTTTLSPGSSATVANVGTSSAAVFNFGIPQGQVGATGPQGSQGPSGAAATIAAGTTTTGAAGTSASVTNVGTSSAAVFNFTIPRGDKGDKGDTGNTGSPGAAATITAGTTTTLSPGASATVTNSGTSGAAVFDFGIPAGQTGATGATGATGPVGPGVASGGTTGQALVKASGTNYDTTWTTIVPGDRYLTTSTTSLTIGNGNKTLTVGTGLSYTVTQNVTLAYDASNHMHGEVLAYDSGTGAMTVDVNHHTGAGTYASWTVNVGGVTPTTSTAWGTITGTLSAQTDLQAALDTKLTTANNLSELTATASTARTNLGLGTAAVEPATKLVPAGGTTGQVLAKASNADWDDVWTTVSGGGNIDIQSFGSAASSGTFTWTKPANAKQVHVFMWGGGAGGGSGACAATTSARGGGGGGGGGSFFYGIIQPEQLNATETVVVGFGGAGGAGVTSGNGNVGVGGGITTFKIWKAVGGGFGLNGTTAAGGAGGGVRTSFVFIASLSAGGGGAGATGTPASAGASTSQHNAPSGGGGGAGQLGSSTGIISGGNGGNLAFALNNAGLDITIAGGTGGNPSGPVAATAGTTTANSYVGGTGGGGGYYRTAFAGATGGAGGWPGGGGGGGGACDTGFTSGAGGAGARGRVVIITYC